MTNQIQGRSRLWVKTDKFKQVKPICERKYAAGYIGRMDYEKAVERIAAAFYHLKQRRDDKQFVMIGDGILSDTVKFYDSQINYPGWIDFQYLPEYLNDIQIVVIASHSEVLPHIIGEAMACGCVVLSTKVGIVEDVIRDGYNGFFLIDNEVHTIVKSVDILIDYIHLQEVANGAVKTIQANYTLEKVAEGYREVLC